MTFQFIKLRAAWLSRQLVPCGVRLQEPPILSQQVLLSLLQQLGYDLTRDSATKLTWIRDAALALDPQVCAGRPALLGRYQRCWGFHIL